MSPMKNVLAALGALGFTLPAQASNTGTTEWIAPETDTAGYTRTITLADGETDFSFPLLAPEPGYVVPEAGAPAGLTISWFDGEGFDLARGATRFGVTDDIEGRLTRPDGIEGELNLALTFYPEMDFTEPNDDPLLAWPISPFELNQTYLFPANDVDAFRFTLVNPMDVRLSIADPTLNLSISYVDLATGNTIASGRDASLNAGEYAVLLSLPNSAPKSPEPIAFALIHKPSPRQAVNPQGSVPTVNVPWDLGAIAGYEERVKVSFDKPGYYQFAVSNAGSGFTITVANSEGVTREGNLYLPAGEFEIIIKGRRDMGLPSFLTISRSELPDKDEPNDLVTDATPLKGDKPKLVRIEPESPIDWISFPVSKPGDHYFRIKTLKNYCKDMLMGYPTGLNTYQTIPVTGSGEYRVFGPYTVPEEQDIDRGEVYIYCNRPSLTSEVELSVIPPGTQTTETIRQDDSGSIYVVGLELNDGVTNQLIAASEAANVAFLPAAEANDLSKRIEDIVEAESRKPISWTLLVAMLGVGIAGLIFVIRARRQRR